MNVQLFTVTELCLQNDVPRSRMDYAVRTSGVCPVEIIGTTRRFSADQIPAIRQALSQIRPQKKRKPLPQGS